MKRKNFAMRIAALLFILTMISTCAFATTFAKYVTSGSANDGARVAKWGVVVTALPTAEDQKLFDTTYDNGAVVSSVAEEKVVAPGTEGSLAMFTVDGQPEVAFKVEYVANLELSGWDVNGNEAGEYCPLVITVTIDGVDTVCQATTMAYLESAVETAIHSANKSYAANEEVIDSITVSWSWAYSTSPEDDVKDTALGDAAAAGNAATIKLTVSCTVTQLDVLN